MDITLTPTAELTADLAVTITPADYQAAFDRRLKEATQKAQLKGFRPGKVPPALVRKMYGKSLLAEEVNRALSEGLTTYIRDQKLRLLGDPMLVSDQASVDFESQQEFKFTFEIGQLPEVELPASNTLAVTRYHITVDDATLEDTMEQIRRQYGATTEPETAATGDYLTGELRQPATDFTVQTMLPVDKLKANQDLFVGRANGDVVTFDLQQALGNDAGAIASLTGVNREQAANLNGEFEFAISKITRTAAPEMNQELFDKVFGPGNVTSEDEFREKIRLTVQDNFDREAEKSFIHHVVDTVVQNTSLQLPESFMKKWLLVTNEKLTQELVDQNIGSYANELRWSMIRSKVAEEQKLNVTGEEVLSQATQNLLDQFGMSDADGEVREQVAKFADQQLRQENGKLYRDTYEAILAGKVVTYLRGVVVATESTVTAEEFRTMSF